MIKRNKAGSEPQIEVLIDGERIPVEAKIDWKLWWYADTRKPAGQGWAVIVAGPDENLPKPSPMPATVEERGAIMLILKRKARPKCYARRSQ